MKVKDHEINKIPTPTKAGHILHIIDFLDKKIDGKKRVINITYSSLGLSLHVLWDCGFSTSQMFGRTETCLRFSLIDAMHPTRTGIYGRALKRRHESSQKRSVLSNRGTRNE